jgi:hypothetical protein
MSAWKADFLGSTVHTCEATWLAALPGITGTSTAEWKIRKSLCNLLLLLELFTRDILRVGADILSLHRDISTRI